MAQYDINLREYWRVLRKRKYIVIFITLLLTAFFTFYSILSAPPALYTSTCSIKFEKEATLEGLYAQALSWYGDNDIQTQIAVIKSYPVLTDVAKKLDIIPQDTQTDALNLEPEINAKIVDLQSRVDVIRQEYTSILDIHVTHSNAAFAKKLAMTIALTYKELHAVQQGKRTADALEYIGNQLEVMRQKNQMAEENLSRFSRENQIISIDMQSENILLRANAIRDEIRKHNTDQKELRALMSRLENFINDPSVSDINFYSAKADQQYQTTTNTLVELLLKRDSLLEDFTDQHPEVIAVNRKVMEHARKMQMLLRLQIDSIEDVKSDLNLALQKENRKANLLMEKRLEYNRLLREAESTRDMTNLLEQRNQEALIRDAERPEEVIIVKPAFLPSSRINPPKTFTTGAMGVVIGIVLGLILAFIVETFDTSLGAIEDVEETLGAKVLGVIPHADSKDVVESLKDKYPEGMDEQTIRKAVYLVSHFAPKTMISESYRALRTNIQFREDDSLKTIAITSTSPQEGKTQISINLALSMAQAGLKTLLVGSDLRKPMLAKAFGLEVIPGLTDILLGNYPWQDTIKTITDIIMGKMTMDEVMMTPGMDNLHIITSGTLPPNPAELIDSRRLMDFIDEVKKEYDIVIFDSTPVVSTADAAILGTKVDGVLIVYRVGSVSRGLLKRSSTQLEQVKCNIIGVILNGMKPDISPDFQEFRYYQAYYGNGGAGSESTGSKKWFSFFGKKGEGKNLFNSSILPSSARGVFPKEKKQRTSPLMKWFLILMALFCLTIGILWQSGILDPIQIYHSIIRNHAEQQDQVVEPKSIKVPIKRTPKE